MRKFRLYYDKEKEEKWLNEMCRQGWGMTNFFLGVYTFAPCARGEYIYQVDLPDIYGSGRDEKRREYIEFVESTGAEYVCSWGFYMIFRKEISKGEFKLYTDAESQIKLYQRFRMLFFLVGVLEFLLSLCVTSDFLKAWTDVFELENIFLLLCLCIVYLITATLFAMAVRCTMKIQKLMKN